MADKQLMVSVVIISYNQEKFIAKTIESVLNQKVDFKYEIIIADDHSTDGTINIINSFQEKHKDKITIIKSKSNIGPHKNGLNGYNAAKGKYATWIDGDDYWTHEFKLQKQTDFLEANDEYIGCFHDARIVHEIDESGNSTNRSQGEFKYYSQFNEYRPDFFPWHLLKRNLIPTASLLFRNGINLEAIPGIDKSALSLNWALQLTIIKNGKLKYFNEPWSIYNDHPLGVSKKFQLNDFKGANIKILNALLEDDYYSSLKRDIYESMAHEYMQIMLSPESTELTKSEFEALSKSYLDSCKNLIRLLSESHEN